MLGLVATLLLAQPPARVPVARATSPAASFAARQPGAAAFEVLPDDAELHTGDLLVTLPGAAFDAKNGSVSVKSLADYDSRSPLPILETALTLLPAGDADFAVAFDRGRVDVTNKKPAGAATVVVKFWDQTWKITLESPGTRVALELCGRWPSGSRFRVAKAKEDHPGPTASLIFLVLSGEAKADIGGVTLGMKAPPGPAVLEWDSVGGARPQPQKLDALPKWADPDAGLSEDGKKQADAVEKFRKARAANPASGLATFLESSDPREQRVALVTLGAIDDLAALRKELNEAQTYEQWDFGITVLRHWLGRCAGHDQRLYEAIVADGAPDPHARTVLQLLFGFAPPELAQPETYEVLIEYLRHDRPSVRNLAAWHLHRLVPQGKAIPFRPTTKADEIDKTYQAWKKLLPAGQVPKR
jgi:hypothetical protein